MPVLQFAAWPIAMSRAMCTSGETHVRMMLSYNIACTFDIPDRVFERPLKLDKDAKLSN